MALELGNGHWSGKYQLTSNGHHLHSTRCCPHLTSIFALHSAIGLCILRFAQYRVFFSPMHEGIFLAANMECSAGSNDHFVVGGGGAAAVPSLVQFDGRPLGGANFQY
jgi:hypothetical protein